MTKTDVVLIDTGFDGPQRFAREARSQPHLGLAYIAAVLERHSRAVKIIDRIAEQHTLPEIKDLIRALSPRVVGITTSTMDRFLSFKILKAVKECDPSILTVGGGPHFSSTAVDALERLADLDVICVGEGEVTFCEIVETFLKNVNDYAKIDGVVYRDGGRIRVNKPRKVIVDLDTLPSPAWHLFDMDKYVGTLATVPGFEHKAIGVGSTRGCPYSCLYCYNSLDKNIRYFSVKRFVDELELLHRTYDYKAFNFVDDSFTQNIKRVFEICNEILKRNLDIYWYCSMNVNQSAKDIEMLRIMREAGCVAVGVGVEFADDAILRNIHKGSTTKTIRRAMINIKKVGFPFVHIFLLQGMPGQNIFNTVAAALRAISYRIILEYRGAHFGQFGYFGGFVQIYPGTGFEKLAKEAGSLDKNFSWNVYHAFSIAEKYGDSPNQRNKISTVPIFVPKSISLDTILSINKCMRFVERVLRKIDKSLKRFSGKTAHQLA